MARGIAPRWQAQLTKDLATGAPIPYRRVPGRVRRDYYNPLRPQDPLVTEHYVLRIYRPALSNLEQQIVAEQSSVAVGDQLRTRGYLASNFQATEIIRGNNISPEDAASDPNFVSAYDRFMELTWEVKHRSIDDPDRWAMLQPHSELDDVMVILGLRTGRENFPIGESPQHAGATGYYTQDVVFPYLERRASRGLL